MQHLPSHGLVGPDLVVVASYSLHPTVCVTMHLILDEVMCATAFSSLFKYFLNRIAT